MIFSFSNSCTAFFFLLHISIKCCLLNISLVLIWAEGFCYHWPLGDQFSCTEPVLVFSSFFSKSCISTSVEPFVCWHLPHFQLNECLKPVFLSPHTDMPLPWKCWGDMKVLLRSGGDFDVNDVPQGTQPHSSWVRFYAQKCKIFSPCIIKVLQESLPKPVSASVNSKLLAKSQFSAPTCARRSAFIIANVSCCILMFVGLLSLEILTLLMSSGHTLMGKPPKFTLFSSSPSKRCR